MTIRHLKIFIEVAGTGNMSQAAEKLFITQPSVSQAIADIERYYQIRLFERFSKKLFITEAGRELLGYARHIVSLFEEMEAVALNRAEVPFLRVGATVTVGTCVIGPVLERLKALRPETETAVMVDNTRVIEEKLVQSELDVALVEGRIKSGELKVEPVVNDQLVLIAGPDHPFYKRKKVQLAELNGQPFILREKGSGTRELFEERMAAEGYTLREKWVCNNSEAIKKAVMGGQGLSVISTLLVEEEIHQGKLASIPIEGCPLHRKFSLVYHRNKYLTEPLKDFMAVCRKQ
ncbi:LysR family transcriptional regulator [Gehongia tenuis]|uniref:LysR family transcriptional regulator n=1 Tax=Gehongia tenuis TaxID=2763655 RepID=A0A926D6G7_9FIRM|nr:LysR family transcriptional regulator [Gehongia tenuis]MBC8531719.1 LysR family transcriptional regulator [Gehongia tenuis]